MADNLEQLSEEPLEIEESEPVDEPISDDPIYTFSDLVNDFSAALLIPPIYFATGSLLLGAAAMAAGMIVPRVIRDYRSRQNGKQ